MLKKPALTQRETQDLVFDSCLANQLQNLFKAIKLGTREQVRDCIFQTPDLNAFDPITGHTALTYALTERRFQSAGILLVMGADPNRPDSFGTPPLHHAVQVRSFEAIQSLLRHKADKTLQDSDGQLAVDLCKEQVIAKML